MAYYPATFDNLNLSKVKHHRTKEVLEVGDVKKGKGYCGVVHVRNIQWESRYSVHSANVELYCTSFEETNALSKETGSTDHRVMMEGLSLWKKFEGLKLRACDKDGKRRQHGQGPDQFDVTKEDELFYGFTRKNDVWYSTSCTLNS